MVTEYNRNIVKKRMEAMAIRKEKESDASSPVLALDEVPDEAVQEKPAVPVEGKRRKTDAEKLKKKKE